MLLRVYVCVQSFFGTGALRIAADFLEKFYRFPSGGVYECVCMGAGMPVCVGVFVDVFVGSRYGKGRRVWK